MPLFVSLHITGHCGFPGRLLNGRVFIEDDSELGRGALHEIFLQNHKQTNKPYVVEEISENTWNKQELYRVVYRCDYDPLMGSDGESGYYFFRECIDGKWTGENPQCGELRA